MGYVYTRGAKLWLAYKDRDGAKQRAPTGLDVGQEKAAAALLSKVEARVAAGEDYGPGPLTFRAFAKRWLEEREARGLGSSATNRHQFAHVLPIIGDMVLADIRPRHLQDLVLKLREAKMRRGTGKLAPRTVRGIYGTLHTLFEDAAAQELVDANPCKLRRGQLPKKVDKDPTWRARAVFTRGELELLISHPSIPDARRVAYAIKLLAGLRFGEESALRWRNYDPDLEPLGRLEVAASFDSAKRREKGTKTEQPRAVPVHPVLAKVLAAWRLGGWVAMVGRQPTPDDLVIPIERKGEWTHRLRDKSQAALAEDLELLGLRHRRGHDMRRTFITLARADGARADLLEMVTHGVRGDIVNIYTSMPWAPLCAEVAKLNVQLHEGQVLRLVATAGAGPQAPQELGTSKRQGTAWAQREEKRGDSAAVGGWGTRIRSGPAEPNDTGPRGVSPQIPGGYAEASTASRGDAVSDCAHCAQDGEPPAAVGRRRYQAPAVVADVDARELALFLVGGGR